MPQARFDRRKCDLLSFVCLFSPSRSRVAPWSCPVVSCRVRVHGWWSVSLRATVGHCSTSAREKDTKILIRSLTISLKVMRIFESLLSGGEEGRRVVSNSVYYSEIKVAQAPYLTYLTFYLFLQSRGFDRRSGHVRERSNWSSLFSWLALLSAWFSHCEKNTKFFVYIRLILRLICVSALFHVQFHRSFRLVFLFISFVKIFTWKISDILALGFELGVRSRERGHSDVSLQYRGDPSSIARCFSPFCIRHFLRDRRATVII